MPPNTASIAVDSAWPVDAGATAVTCDGGMPTFMLTTARDRAQGRLPRVGHRQTAQTAAAFG